LPDGKEIAATGKTVKDATVSVSEVRDGKFTTMRDYFDTAAAMRQLGLLAST
jgi:ketosteroid isomerase-like protein